MSQLVEVNECNMLVNIQLKEDRMYGTMPLTSIHRMNVIIKKNKRILIWLNLFLEPISPQFELLFLKQ